jgi:type IV secretory pathway TrbD component
MDQFWFLLCSYGAALDFALQLWISFGFCSTAIEQLWFLLCSHGAALVFVLQLWISFGV